MSIGCVGKSGHLFGFLRRYLLNLTIIIDKATIGANDLKVLTYLGHDWALANKYFPLHVTCLVNIGEEVVRKQSSHTSKNH